MRICSSTLEKLIRLKKLSRFLVGPLEGNSMKSPYKCGMPKHVLPLCLRDVSRKTLIRPFFEIKMRKMDSFFDHQHFDHQYEKN